MVTGMRSYLFAAGIDVTKEIVKGSLVLSSSNAHLVEGRFIVDRMLGMLKGGMTPARIFRTTSSQVFASLATAEASSVSSAIGTEPRDFICCE